MKKTFLLAVLGIIAGIAIAKNVHLKRESLHFVEKDDEIVDQDGKNFGAFPPEIPSHQFDSLFI